MQTNSQLLDLFTQEQLAALVVVRESLLQNPQVLEQSALESESDLA